MQLQTHSTAGPLARTTGRILSGLVIAFLIFDGAIKLVPIAPVIETLAQLGFSATPTLARGLGLVILLCTLLYAFPKTSLLGAVLLTGLLGGAMATHLHADSPIFSHYCSDFILD